MTNRFYTNQTHADGKSTELLLLDLARFMINDLAGFTGQSWTIKKTYSSAAGTPFEIPSNPSNMDSLAADNGWRTNDLVNGDYIVLQSSSAIKCEIGLELQSTNTMRVIITYEDGFDTTADEVDMTTEANWVKRYITYSDWILATATGEYSVVATEDYLMIIKTTATERFCWAGLLSHSGDPKGQIAIRYDNDAWLRGSYGGGNTRTLTLGSDDTSFRNDTSVREGDLDSTGYFEVSTNYLLDPVTSTTSMIGTVIASPAGFYGVMGGVYFVRRGTGSGTDTKGTILSKLYGFVEGSTSYPPVGFDWDGVSVL